MASLELADIPAIFVLPVNAVFTKSLNSVSSIPEKHGK